MKTTILYTRKQIAAIIGVTPNQMRGWEKHPRLFMLPKNGRKQIHRQDFLTALNRVHHGGGGVTAIPDAMLSQKELLAYYEIGWGKLATWTANGLPRFVFTKRMLRYDVAEVEVWYLNTYGSRRPS